MELTGAVIIRVPEVLNPISVGELQSSLAEAIAGSSAVVVLSGNGATFCRGLEPDWKESPASVENAVEGFAACLNKILLASKPVVAFVNGEAVGGGVGLAAACDGVLAAAEATFTLPELAFGLMPAVILPYLARRMPLQKLRWLALTASTTRADQALSLGLADAICPLQNAPALLRSWIRALRRMDPDAIATWKNMTAGLPPHPSSKDGVQATISRLRDPKVRAKFEMFLENGEPPWLDADS